MTAFSPSDAAVEGFRLIGARWRVLVGWGLFNLIALLALLTIMVVILLGVTPFAANRETAATTAGVIAGVVVGLGEVFVQIILLCGLLRLELRPDEPGFLHLRIGRDELRVLAAVMLWALTAIVLAALVVGATALSARVSSLLAALVAVCALAVFYGVMLRLGLVSPIAFAEKRISLLASWRRTGGHFWSLAGMALLLLCLMLLAWVVVWFALFLVNGFTTGFGDLGLTGAEAFEAHPGRYLFQLATQFLLAPFWLVIGQAPWIAAYRALPPAKA